MTEVRGRLALVSGGASGIGLAIASSLARRGARVAIADIDESATEAALPSLAGDAGSHVGVRLDVTSLQSWSSAQRSIEDRCGPIDILCNNAGVASCRGTVDANSDEDWRWVYEVNVHGVRNGLVTCLPAMKASGRPGHVVTTASILSHFPIGGASDYVSTKFAVLAMSECLRQELAGSKVGVSVVCPGLVDTSLNRNTEQRRPSRRQAPVDAAAAPASLVKPSAGLDPAMVGEAVVTGIERDDFYVFTHPEYASVIGRRFDNIGSAVRDARAWADPEDVGFLGGGLLRVLGQG